mmetsp:Transcript_489/g.1254  ORF Transcript_489/g.1254 Transcript_489/m.1254 type:complete len:229 (+) Transcript_489:804-1490(+)
MAPAPSPKRIHWLRSLQSTTRERASAPITRAFVNFVLGLLKYIPAVTVPNKKPLQAAVRSKAIVFVEHPISAAIAVASPNISSGLLVAQMTTSISSAVRPAISNASLAALPPSSRRDSPLVRTRRCAIPVRVRIHSSSVSTTDSKSVFVITVLGAAWPTPIGRQLSVPDWAMDNWLFMTCCGCVTGAKAKEPSKDPAAKSRNAFLATVDNFMIVVVENYYYSFLKFRQ